MSEHQPTIPADYGDVPDELKDRDQWLLWSEDSNPPKKPLNSDGYGASWNDSSEWLAFEDAVDAVETSDRFDGIGFVVAESDPFVLLDLDGCLREPNEAKPKQWLRDICGLESLTGTWGQYSKSGTGMHVYVRNRAVPEWWTDDAVSVGEHEGIEAYEQKFAIVTGHTVDGFSGQITDVGKSPYRSFLFNAYTELSGNAPQVSSGESDTSGNYDGDEWLTDDAVEDALSHISPDVAHDEWIRLAYAVHDYDSTSNGQQIFEQWSKNGSKYDDAAKRSIETIWSDASKGSSVTVGTLVHKAKDNSWNPPTPQPRSTRSKGKGSAAKTDLVDAIDSGWFDSDSQTVRVSPTADYSSADLADRFHNPDDLPTDATLTIYELDGGAEFLNAPEEWTIEQQGATDYSVFAEWTVQEMKQQALGAIPTDRFAWVPEREEWFWCDDAGIWHSHGDEHIRQWLDDYFGPHYRTHLFNEVRDQLKARTRTEEQAFGGGPAGWIATESGLVNLETGDMRAIQPSDRVRWTLGTEYDPDADCPRWKQFVGDVAEPSDIEMLQEFVGYCLHHWNLPYKKALIIFGPTDAGKSVFLDVIQTLFGGDDSPATSSTSIQYLANERWGPARLVNTAVNIRNDLSSETIENAGKVKELIAGDNLDAERKRKPVFKFAPTAKHLFAANRAPDRSIDDEAFWNRWLTVVFPESIPRQYQDPHLTDDLLAELSGILNWAIEGYQRLMSNGRFTDEPLPFQNRNKWERYGNSIEQWFTEYVDQEPDAVTPKWSTDDGTLGAYDSYKAFARSNGLEVETDQTFTAELKQREGISKRKLTVDSRQRQAYRGFRLTDDAPEPEHDNGDGDDNPTEPTQAGLDV